MFDIRFLESDPEIQDEGWLGLWGETVLGDVRESFLAPLSLWAREDYEQHWLAAARRILSESDRTAFFTQAFHTWWTMWREGESIYVHEQLLLADERLSTLSDFSRAPFEWVGERETDGVDGPISEWQLTVGEIQDFIDRRAAEYQSPRLTRA